MYVYFKVEQAPLCDAMMAFAKLMKPRLSVLKGLNYFTISHNGAKNVWKFFMLLQFHKLFICYRVIQGKMTRYQPLFVKVNSVQEACAKFFAVHLLKFEILQITWKKWNKKHQTLSFQLFINRSSILMFFVLFFHVVCKISNFDMWTAKHLVQASCTELTLIDIRKKPVQNW